MTHDIIERFKNRDEMFHLETKDILHSLQPTLTGASNFIDDIYGIDVNRTLVWGGVNLIDNIITLIGVVSYKPGTKLMFNNELMDITQDNHEYFQQLIKVEIPVQIVLLESVTKIHDYLNKQQDKKNEIDSNEGKEQTSQLNDFDLKRLTNEQMNSLIFPTNHQIN